MFLPIDYSKLQPISETFIPQKKKSKEQIQFSNEVSTRVAKPVLQTKSNVTHVQTNATPKVVETIPDDIPEMSEARKRLGLLKDNIVLPQTVAKTHSTLTIATY